MSRWHDKDCLRPRVEAEDGTPKCLNCGRATHLADLKACGATANSAAPVPVEKPFGQRNLWWPPSVPYRRAEEGADEQTGEADGDSEWEDLSQQMTNGKPEEHTLAVKATPLASNMYSETLKPDEFRLVCISASRNLDCLVHFDLEVYSLDDCPEYETVSYTWAGENDDSMLSCPIYIGDYWDVMLQTKNCWEMLHFIRPLQGKRMVWVDAVCINQSNIPERSNQVANMGRIYSGCSRVILYLGPDIAMPLEGRYPRRRRLHELETGSVVPEFSRSQKPPRPLTLRSLLGRRYFSRMWVIQELILSPQVVIRVGDVDFWADAAMSKVMSLRVAGWAWEETAAPWVQYLCQGAIMNKDMSQLLLMSSEAHATDPRDKIFALLGILPRRNHWLSVTTSPSEIRADYSLSFQHVLVGSFGHCLINSNDSDFLYQALGVEAPSGYPSWTPNLEPRRAGSRLFQVPGFDSQYAFNYICKYALDKKVIRRGRFLTFHHLVGQQHKYIEGGRPWDCEAHLSVTTGSLNINLTQYFKIDELPVRVSKLGRYYIFKLPRSIHPIYIFSEYELDTIMGKQIQGEEVFILKIRDQPIKYLILRPIEGSKNSFKLVATCPFLFVVEHSNTMSYSSDWHVSYDLADVQLARLQLNLYDLLSRVQHLLKQNLNVVDFENRGFLIRSFFPHAQTLKDILWPCVSLFNLRESRGLMAGDITSSEKFEKDYLECVRSKYDVEFDQEYIKFRIESAAWQQQELWRLYVGESSPWLQQVVKNYYDDCEGLWISLTSRVAYLTFPTTHSGWAVVRCRATELRNLAYSGRQINELFQCLGPLSHVAQETGEDIKSLLTREPREEDRFVGCASWSGPSVLFNNWKFRTKLGMFGSTNMVEIL
nr:uncharacterized protein CTRU02_01987 [Colletotrichum truncatum]KAF6799116.1 hypothetical protein CTRU02_01987 [Colletotrichum truncatum]